MRKLIFFALWGLLAVTTAAQNSQNAQDVRETLKKNLLKAGSNYYAYPEPVKSHTPAPEGKVPFYLSHYARHGSRYLINSKEYERPYRTLQKAARSGKLSQKGIETLENLHLIAEEARGRYGELTPLGAIQHQLIAQRMYDRFPGIFSDSAIIEAKSTVVIRCILSMQNELLQLAKNNPQLKFKFDASEHDMYYMNHQDSALYKKRFPKEMVTMYEDFCKKRAIHEQAMGRLFNDSAYAHDSVDTYNLNRQLFKVASSVQGTNLRTKVNLYDLYTHDELFNNWEQWNAFWYLSFGCNPHNGSQQPFTQRYLLRKIIEEADSCIAVEKPGATLRFGHETIVLPLTCLLGINGFGREFHDLNQLDLQGWINFEVFPMAANIQFVFYRKDLQDKDVLVKVLLNENEATLPIATDCAPYYHWNDFRDFYLKKLDAYQE